MPEALMTLYLIGVNSGEEVFLGGMIWAYMDLKMIQFTVNW